MWLTKNTSAEKKGTLLQSIIALNTELLLNYSYFGIFLFIKSSVNIGTDLQEDAGQHCILWTEGSSYRRKWLR